MLISIAKNSLLGNLFILIVFCYFLSSSIDLVNFNLILFKLKPGLFISLMLLLMMFVSKMSLRLDKRLVYCFISIITSMTVSTLFCKNLTRAVGYECICLYCFGCYFLVCFNLYNLFDREVLLRVYLRSFLFVGIYAAIQFLLSFANIYDPFALQRVGSIARGQALTYEPSFYALYAIPFVAFFNSKYIFGLNNYNSLEVLKLVFINCLLLVSTSTGGFFSYFVFFVVCFVVSFFKKLQNENHAVKIKLFKIAGFFAVCFVLVGVWLRELFLHSFYKFFHIGFLAHWSFAARWQGIKDTWQIFLDHPFFGVGLGGVGPYLYQHYQYDGRDTQLYNPTLEMLERHDPSNMLTEVLACLGICGFVAFLALICVCLKFFKDILLMPNLSQKDRTNILSLLVSLIVMVICLQFNQGIFRSYIWIHAGISLGYVANLKTALNK